MGFKCGIVGLPNVGKSTLFNALTHAAVAASNYPFCTIDPNVGIVPVPDPRLDRLAEIAKPERIVPTTVEFVDIAGLVQGASKGEGLGNQFLAHIRETQAIAHVVRCFEDPNVVHVSGRVDPAADIAIIETELALADLGTVEKMLSKATKAAKAGDKQPLADKSVLERLAQHLNRGEPARTLPLPDKEREAFDLTHLLTAKPVLYIANVDERSPVDNPLVECVRTIAAQEGARVVALCAAIEADIAAMEASEQREFLAAMNLKEPGLHRVIRAGYELLNLETFFTAGPKEVRAWTIPKGARAPQAAGVIHSDFEKGFIRAEVIAFADYLRHGGEHGAKEAGKLRLEGKDYIVQDGDVMHFRFNV